MVFSKLYKVTEMLLKGYYEISYKKDVHDPRIIRGIRFEDNIIKRLSYLDHRGIKFEEPKGPYDLLLENEGYSDYLESLSLYQKDIKESKILFGYSNLGNKNLITRIDKALKEEILDNKILQILNIIKHKEENNFLTLNFEYGGEKEKLQDLIVVIMGLKPRN